MNKKVWLPLVGLAVVGAGVGAYFIFREKEVDTMSTDNHIKPVVPTGDSTADAITWVDNYVARQEEVYYITQQAIDGTLENAEMFRGDIDMKMYSYWELAKLKGLPVEKRMQKAGIYAVKVADNSPISSLTDSEKASIKKALEKHYGLTPSDSAKANISESVRKDWLTTAITKIIAEMPNKETENGKEIVAVLESQLP